jgi:hypothetical protein
LRGRVVAKRGEKCLKWWSFEKGIIDRKDALRRGVGRGGEGTLHERIRETNEED